MKLRVLITKRTREEEKSEIVYFAGFARRGIGDCEDESLESDYQLALQFKFAVLHRERDVHRSCSHFRTTTKLARTETSLSHTFRSASPLAQLPSHTTHAPEYVQLCEIHH